MAVAEKLRTLGTKIELNVPTIKVKRKIQSFGFPANPDDSSWSSKLSNLKMEAKTAKIIMKNEDKKNSPERWRQFANQYVFVN